MEQYTDNQYDDDLTIGADEFGDTFQTSDVDLFEFGGDEESPISRLKTLVLSIDWEITDEVLLQFNEEIVDLKDIWAGDKVRMVYLQALEKISRYIYRDKSDAHPNAIKLLLGMYYNLEKIVSSEDLSEREIKRLLLKDVRKFEKLKVLIGQAAGAPAGAAETAGEPAVQGYQEPPVSEVGLDEDYRDHELIDLKALVLGIDWEITEKDLLELRQEVMRLEERYADSRPKLVFLQGIGTLATYILKKKSNSHADAFTLLHSFYDGLEKIVLTPMSLDEEKAVLFPEVDKFNEFKELIASTITSETREVSEEDEEGPDYSGSGDVAPAFAEMAEEDTHGFQEEVEAASLAADEPVLVDQHINKFFGEDEDQPVPPAEEPEIETEPDFMAASVEKEAEALSDAFFTDGDETDSMQPSIDRETALKGVDVETEADDDSDEEALPEFDGEVAPALADSSDKSAFAAEELEKVSPEEEVSEEITGKLDNFFVDLEGGEEGLEPSGEGVGVPAEVALQGVDVETAEDEEDQEDVKSAAVAAQAFEDEELEESVFAVSDETESEEAPVAALFDAVFDEEPEVSESDAEAGEEPLPAFADIEVEEEGEGELAFDDTLPEEGLFADDDILEDSLEEALAEPVDEQEIASALAGYEEEGEEYKEFQAVPAALAHIDEPGVPADAEEFSAETEEAEVAEQFDALFGAADLEEQEVAGGLAEEDTAEQVEQFFEETEELSAAPEEEEVVFAFDDEFAAPAEEEAEVAEGVEAALAGTAAAAAAVVETVAEEDEEYAAVFTAADGGEGLEQGEAVVVPPEGGAEEELIGPLKECVQSLALELEDSVVEGLFKEIGNLRQHWAEKPLEKSYLQLLSTVAQHIDQYRYEASSESHELLSKLTHNLELSQDQSVEKIQENLLADTYQILQWQQNMLSRQAVSRGGQLTFLDPLRAEMEDEETAAKVELSDDTFADEFAAELESAMTEGGDSEEEELEEVFVDSLDEEIDTFVPEGDDTVDLDLEEALSREVEQARKSLAGTAVEDVAVTEIVRQEIESLRKVLQDEIAELRAAIKGTDE